MTIAPRALLRFAFALALAFSLALGGGAAPAARAEIEIDAEELSYEKGRTVFRGGAVARARGITLRADRIEVFGEEEVARIVARGRPAVLRGDAIFAAADEIDYERATGAVDLRAAAPARALVGAFYAGDWLEISATTIRARLPAGAAAAANLSFFAAAADRARLRFLRGAQSPPAISESESFIESAAFAAAAVADNEIRARARTIELTGGARDDGALRLAGDARARVGRSRIDGEEIVYDLRTGAINARAGEGGKVRAALAGE